MSQSGSNDTSDPQTPMGSDANRGKAHEVRDDVTRVQEMKQWMREFVDERDWQGYHNAKNLSMSLAIEAGELMEHFQWLTTEQVENKTGYELDAVREELADVTCYALSIANALDIDLASAISDKMKKNRLKYPESEQAANQIVRREQTGGAQ